MEQEAFFSGYCRAIDASRMVAVEMVNHTLTEVDCCYETCPYQPNCPIAQAIQNRLQQ